MYTMVAKLLKIATIDYVLPSTEFGYPNSLVRVFCPKTLLKENEANEQVRNVSSLVGSVFHSAIFYNSNFMLFDRM